MSVLLGLLPEMLHIRSMFSRAERIPTCELLNVHFVYGGSRTAYLTLELFQKDS